MNCTYNPGELKRHLENIIRITNTSKRIICKFYTFKGNCDAIATAHGGGGASRWAIVDDASRSKPGAMLIRPGYIYRLRIKRKLFNRLKEVDHKKYFMKYANVLTPYMGYFNVRIYIQAVNPLPRGDRDLLPVERWPSWTYQQVMILGAKENGVPHYYIRNLKTIPNNGEEGALRMVHLIDRYAEKEICDCRVPGKIQREPLKLDLAQVREQKKK